MNMNKYFKNIMLAAVAVLGMTTLAACSSSDDDSEEEQKPTSGNFVFSYYLNEDILKVADITITYTDCSGNETTETVTADKCTKDTPAFSVAKVTLCYTKEIKAASLPATSSYQVTWTRNNSELSQDSYNLSDGMYITFEDNTGAFSNPGNISGRSINKSNIDGFINESGKFNKVTYKATAEGVLE